MQRSILFLFLLLACVAPAVAQTAADSSAIVAVALDYIEGWYTGDAARMEKALHPDLAKRIVHTRDGQSTLQSMGAGQLVEGTQRGFGKQIPAERQHKEVTILDIYGNTASVKILASDWVDYLHVARWNGAWKIVNVLWELTPEAKKQMYGSR